MIHCGIEGRRVNLVLLSDSRLAQESVQLGLELLHVQRGQQSASVTQQTDAKFLQKHHFHYYVYSLFIQHTFHEGTEINQG